jgi:predicted NBD/HSP70 family sugar kinase
VAAVDAGLSPRPRHDQGNTPRTPEEEEPPEPMTSRTEMSEPFPSKATHQQTRAHNTALVLRALYDFGPISRADVARLSGLTRTTVGDVAGELISEGLAREAGRGPSTGGKAPILLELVDGARHVIGLDLGEFVFRGALLDLRGRVVATTEREVRGLDGDRALQVVHELIDALTPDPRTTLLGIGVGTPGIVDAATGTIRWAVNLDWQDLPLGEILRDRHGAPVQVANDSRAAALAIQLFGERRSSNLVAIKVGRGIGAGVVLGGELFHGDGFGAGEIGHTVVDPDGVQCRCGRFGCLETVASSRALVTRAEEIAREYPESALGRAATANGRLTLDDIAAALDTGDEEARRVVVAAGRYLGQVVATLIGVLDVERIVLHGSVAGLGEAWLEAVRDEARRRSLGLLSQRVTIELAPPIGDLVVMGASALLLIGELGLAVSR